MKFQSVIALTLFSLMLALCLPVPTVWAENPRHDVRVLIDISGSMKKNDPKNLRRPAVQLLAELLPKGTQAGVWTFGGKVNMLVPLSVVDKPWQKLANDKASKINSVAQRTNIGLALGTASVGWNKPDPKTERSLILLTDGKVDVSKNGAANTKARREILEKILPRLKRANVSIHSIALSEQADLNLLKELSFSTDGQFAVAQNDDELVKVFVAAFDKAVEQDQIPLEGNRFEVDGGVQEFTLLAHRVPNTEPAKLMTPSNKIVTADDYPDNVSWFATASFDLITVDAPERGGWTLQAEFDPDNRVTVVSDLKLIVNGLPNNVLQEELITVDVYLTEADKIIKRAEFLSLMDIKFRQEYVDQDRVWEGMLTSYNSSKIKTPTDGIYEAKLGKSLLTGQHRFLITVDGKTFKRQKTHILNVLDAALEVKVVEEADPGDSDNIEYFLNLIPVPGVMEPSELTITVRVKMPDGTHEVLPVEKTPFGTWRVDILPTNGPGTYSATVRVDGLTQSGRGVSLVQKPVEIHYGDKQTMEMAKSTEDIESMPEMEVEKPEPKIEKPVEKKPESEPKMDDEPDPKPEPEPEQVQETMQEDVDTEMASDDMQDEDLTDALTYGLIGLSNIVLFAAAFFGYRFLTRQRESEDDMAEQQMAEASERRKAAYEEIESMVFEEDEVSEDEDYDVAEDVEPEQIDISMDDDDEDDDLDEFDR